MTEPESDIPYWRKREGRIASIASQIGRSDFSTGDRAALRRLDPDRPNYAGLAVVLRVMRNAGIKIDELGTRRLGRWTLLIHAMALMSGPGKSPHVQGKGRSGGVLHAGFYSESRLMRLLEARGTTRDDLIRRLARFLAAKGLAIDWVALAPLILDDEDGEDAERARLRIARDYYAAEARDAAQTKSLEQGLAQ